MHVHVHMVVGWLWLCSQFKCCQLSWTGNHCQFITLSSHFCVQHGGRDIVSWLVTEMEGDAIYVLPLLNNHWPTTYNNMSCVKILSHCLLTYQSHHQVYECKLFGERTNISNRAVFHLHTQLPSSIHYMHDTLYTTACTTIQTGMI